jgi:hypothetical protein
VGDLRHEVRARRRDHDDVAIARMLDVAHAVGDAAVPEIGPYGLPRQRLERYRRDEAGRRFGHDHAHIRAAADQQAHELGRLVGCDAAADTQEDTITRQRHGSEHR